MELVQKNFQRQRYARGASTITMQLARNAFLSKEKTITRKIREIIIARRMEQLLSKHRMFELYLNIVEWGPNIYGAEAASRYYFAKSASELNMAEASIMAAILPNPKRYNLITNIKRGKRLQKNVLFLLKNAKKITSGEYDSLLVEPIYLRGEVDSLKTNDKTK